MSVIKKKWVTSPFDSLLQLKIAEKLNISPVLAQLCINRGMTTFQEVENFIRVNPSDIHDPFSFSQMRQAVDLIEGTMEKQEKILIYGDYDVDGITATSLLYLYLRRRTSLVSYYIPDRMEEGYGLNEEAVYSAHREGYKLIITVDCGISSVHEADVAKSLGLSLIITDHHNPPEMLPDATAIINPKVMESSYPFLNLAGVGVAWKLAQALEINSGQNNTQGVVLGDFLDLVTLGTVADVVPLIGENRIIVTLGLKTIAESSRPGIKALRFVTGLENKPVSTGQIGFILAPRLNAVGRLSQSSQAVKLLTGEDYGECVSLAEELDRLNSERQDIEAEILEEAQKMIEERVNLAEDFVIVLASEKWHPGVIGIVSSRLMEKYYRPVVLLSIEGDLAKGSARSINEFDIFQAFNHCREYLVQFGGHKMAAGVKIKKEDILSFQKAINNYARDIINMDSVIPTVKIDLDLDASGSEEMYLEDCECLAPFGAGNSTPVFAYRNLRIAGARAVGSNQSHLKVTLDAGNYFLDGVGFNLAHHLSWINPFCRVDVAAVLEKNKWNGSENIQLVLKDIRPHEGFSQAIGGSKSAKVHIIGQRLLGEEFLADYRDMGNREEYLLNLLNKKENCLIYVSAPTYVEEIIKWIAKNCPADIKTGCCYEYQRPWQHGLTMAKVKSKTLNTVVFTGNLYTEIEGLFSNIIFFHSPRNLEELLGFISLDGSEIKPKIHLLFNMSDMKKLDYNLKTVFPDRELLGKIYKSVRQMTAAANRVLASREEILRKINIDGLDKGKEKAFDAWVSIMVELGLVKMTLKGSHYCLELINNGNKCNLEDSFSYKQGLKEKKAFECWTKIAFSPQLRAEISALLG